MADVKNPSELAAAMTSVKNSLATSGLGESETLNKLEQKTGIDKVHLLLGAGTAILLWLVVGVGQGVICNALGFVYPCYASFKAIESKEADDDTKWLTYWVVYAFFFLLEHLEFVVSWFRFYYACKMLFLCFLFARNAEGARVIYKMVLRPLFKLVEAKLNEVPSVKPKEAIPEPTEASCLAACGKKDQASDCAFVDMVQHILFAGNPGAGKSTLLNCHGGSMMFSSGMSYGQGKTWQLCTRNVGNIQYMDTPGLSDDTLRKQAAESITTALRKGGLYKVVFVVLQQQGRVRSEDVATMKLILDACPEVGNNYGIIVNQMQGKIHKKICTDLNSRTQFLDALFNGITSRKTTHLLYLTNQCELEGEEDKFIEDGWPELNSFIERVPGINLTQNRAQQVDANSWQEQQAILKRQQEALERARAEKEAEQRENERRQAELRRQQEETARRQAEAREQQARLERERLEAQRRQEEMERQRQEAARLEREAEIRRQQQEAARREQERREMEARRERQRQEQLRQEQEARLERQRQEEAERRHRMEMQRREEEARLQRQREEAARLQRQREEETRRREAAIRKQREETARLQRQREEAERRRREEEERRRASYCHIASTPNSSGYTDAHCHTRKCRCGRCGRYFCEYHHKINNDQGWFSCGGHVCH